MGTTDSPAGSSAGTAVDAGPGTGTGRWFTPAELPDETPIRLLLLPHAGSGAAAYRGWNRLLPAEVGAQALTLPGRQSRRGEPLPVEWDALLDDLHSAVLATVDDDRPYAMFGHCIGAMLAYRLAVRLEAEGDPAPALLGMSGWAPKGFFGPPPGHEKLSMDEFGAMFKDLGAFPDELWTDPDMLDLVLPPVVADFRIAVQFEDDEAVVDTPVVTYSGDADPLLVEPAAMRIWTGRSRSYLGHQEYPGGHFYVSDHAAAVLSDFTRRLVRLAEA